MSSSSQLRQKLTGLAKDRARAEERSASARREEAKQREVAAKNRYQATRATSASSARSYATSADRAEQAAAAHARKAADAAKQVAQISAKEASAHKDLAAALERETRAAERERERVTAEMLRTHERSRQEERVWTQGLVTSAVKRLRRPKPEQLRILYLTASSEGDLRVDEEMRRVKAAVRASTHRDLVQIEHMPAATTSDLLDGLSRFKPHVVHFSGHASEAVLVFDTGDDGHGHGKVLDGSAFAMALGAVDAPPQLVVLNACSSQGHFASLLKEVPLAIGMTDSVGDGDAMAFAARFYSAIAEGQSVLAAFNLARIQMLFGGLADADLPALAHAPGIEPSQVVLVEPPPEE